MSKKKKPSLLRQLRRLPGDLMSKNPVHRKNAWLSLISMLLMATFLLLAVYAAVWFFERDRIIEDSERYRAMYTTPEPTEAATPSPTPTSEPTPTPAVETPAPTPESDGTVSPAPSAEPAPAVTEDTAYPVPSDVPITENTVSPLATPNENTIIFALPTPPPVQSSFDELLALNSDTIGFLTIDDVIALPVVQKVNDNDYYLTHNFEKNEAIEGALFLDGSNLLIPEDDCLIIYGHNMKNDTMFGKLSSYGDAAFLKSHPLVSFDTLYENRTYVPFAAFTASMNKDSNYYFDVRQFIFDDYSFDQFVSDMKSRSQLGIPVEVDWGDRLLLLVTCNYNNNSGRFILGLRQLRPGEAAETARAAVQKTQLRW